MMTQHAERARPLCSPSVCNLDDPDHVRMIIQSTIAVLCDVHRAVEVHKPFRMDEQDARLLETTQKIIVRHVRRMLPEDDWREIQMLYPQACLYVCKLDRYDPLEYPAIKAQLWQTASVLNALLRRLSEGKPDFHSVPIQSRFTFEPGRVTFDDVDLGLAPRPRAMLEQLVGRLGRVVPYTDFNEHYRSTDPGTVLKDKRALIKAFIKYQVPCTIETKTGRGYILRYCPV